MSGTTLEAKGSQLEHTARTLVSIANYMTEPGAY